MPKLNILSEKDEKTGTFELLINDNWFRDNPSKILGEEYQTTDRFGKPVTKVRGTISVLQGIDVPNVEPAVQHNPIATEIKPEPAVLSPEVEENIKRAVKRTEKQIAETTIQQLYGTKPEFLTGFDEILEEYNPGISKEEIAAWLWYRKQKGDPMAGPWLAHSAIKSDDDVRALVEKGIICYTGTEYIPAVLFYAGNINDKIQEVERHKDVIISTFSEDIYNRQKTGLDAVLPPRLSLIDPVEANRLVISPVSRFAREEFLISELADGTELNEGSSLSDAFEKWLYSLSADDFEGKTTAYEINSYYLSSNSFPRGTEAEEKAEIKKNIRLIGNKLFARFLFEGITSNDQKKLEYMWNARYNSYLDVNYNKVPIGFSCSKTFKNKPLFIRPAQREGIAFNSVNGTSIIAFDVGVGKTLTLILGIAQRMQEGGCKRPLIVVPNQTAKKWVAEIEGAKDKEGNIIASGLLPQYKVLNLFNLGEEYIAKVRDANGKIRMVEENTITVITYEGFKRLAFNPETENTLIDTFCEILNQGIDDARDVAKLMEKVREIIGLGLKDSVVDIEELGFDYLAVDEAHSMKKVFTKVKGEVSGDGKRDKAQYAIDSGTPSALALKGFMMSYYIMHGNGNNQRTGTNVTLLTATPFTNSPLEIYSMLALVGYKELKKLGINNITEFFDTFVNESYELKFNARQEFEMAPVIKGFNNRIVLQNLIYKFISYKTGEEANIERPNKIVLPLLNEVVNGQVLPLQEDKQVSTFLQPTSLQRQLFNDIKAYVRGEVELDDICNASGGMDNEDPENGGGGEKVNDKKLSKEERDKARSLRAINYARQVAVNPYLYACATLGIPTPEEYIEASPVLTYTMECIRSVKAWHEDKKEPVSGQVIYMNAGVDYFSLIKEYLIENVGYNRSEVEIISSGISITKKEKVKEEFLAGNIKIIIGSATIKEGIDLQNRSTVLYNCWVDWNPTDMKQLEGRIWRFGNQFDTVRIVMPLVEDSIHIFLFQKLEEKTSRINDIWFRAGRENVLPLEDVNPEELKLGLLSDPKELAEFTIEEQVKKVNYQKSIVDGKIKTLDTLDQAKKVFADEMKYFESMIPNVRNAEPALADYEITDEKSLIKFFSRYLKNRYNHWMQNKLDNFQKATRVMEKAQKTVLQPNSLTMADDLTPLIEKLKADILVFDDEIARLKGDENKNGIIAEFIHKKENNQLRSRPLFQRVEEFKRLNYLLGIKKVYRQDAKKEEPAKPEPDTVKVKALARAKALILIAKAKLKLQKAA